MPTGGSAKPAIAYMIDLSDWRIVEIVGEMILLLRSEAIECAVSIRTDVAAGLPKFTADRVQLQQVLMNLMLNRIEAMKETGGVLTVKTGQLRWRSSADLSQPTPE